MRTTAYWLTVAFVFSVPWEAAIDVSQVGQLSKIIGWLAGAVWVLSVVGRGRLRQPDAFQKTFFLFLVWCGMTFFWSIDSGPTAAGFRTYTQVFLMLLILWDLCDTKRSIEGLLQAYVLGAFVTSTAIIVDYVTHPPTKYPEHRFLALGFQVDAIALIVALAGPAAWYLAVRSGTPRHRVWEIVNLSYVPVGFFALLLTGTRGATLASLPTVVFILWSLPRIDRRTRMMAGGAVVAAVLGVLVFAPSEPLSRISTVTTTSNLDQGALSGRWEIWHTARLAFQARPVTGGGLASARAALARESAGELSVLTEDDARREAHNAYLSVLVETGVVGLLLLALTVLTVVLRVRSLSGWQRWYWSTQLSVLAIGATSLSIEQRKDVWIFLTLAVAAAAVEHGSSTASETAATASVAASRARLASALPRIP
jgi:hypothetical protein